MFYSQFILAKKGPLGTIWIAAHLERKLRKNQVADTDIGVSVDSILFPEVPIALRLSSHLLLGVVRIYSRKVNYLFDDCSEALVKVRQAFRSTAVDLPPEESKAPYHSITLPETFDLDDFELPDTDIFQGNFVDHHVSSKEQITLQDTMDGVVYSTSQFGLDERFGDGDTSHICLDLDEELFLEKGASSGHGVVLSSCVAPRTAVEPISNLKDDVRNEDADNASGAAPANTIVQGPATPGLMEEPNLPIVQEAQVSEDHMEEDHLLELVPKGGSDIAPREFASTDGASVCVDNTKLLKDMNVESFQEDSMFRSEPYGDVAIHAKGECGQTETIILNGTLAASHRSDDKLPDRTSINGICASISESISVINKTSDHAQISTSTEADKEIEHSNLEHGSLVQKPNELRAEATEILNHDFADVMKSAGMPLLQACSSCSDHANDKKTPGEVQEVLDPAINNNGALVTNSPCEAVDEVPSNMDGELENMMPEDAQRQEESSAMVSDFPSPEKLLSHPDVPIGRANEFLIGQTTQKEALAEGDQDISVKLSGKKRSFTESTVTLQSLNSVESSEAAQSRRSVEFVPDDDDLLSSILVGRRSTALKIKSTLAASELISSKRQRVASRSGAHKRKAFVDDYMVLHGDLIREQLVNTEDIRRIRKKAPSTRPEIWILQKQFLESEVFSEPLFPGFSTELVRLHSQPLDPSGIKIVQDEGPKSKSATMDRIGSPSRFTVGERIDPDGTGMPSAARDGSDKQSLKVSVQPGSMITSEFNDDKIQTMSIDGESGNGTSQIGKPEEGTEMEIDKVASVGIEAVQHSTLEARLSDGGTHEGLSEQYTITNIPQDTSIGDRDMVEQRSEVQLTIRTEVASDLATTNGWIDSILPVHDENNVGATSLECGGLELTSDHVFGMVNEGEMHIVDGRYENESPATGYQLEGLKLGSSVTVEGGLDHGNASLVEALPLEADNQIPLDAATTGVTDYGALEQYGDFEADIGDHDIGFLNFDDEIAQEDDNSMANAEETGILDNSGWSTRTRAVANYLQTLFIKEAQHGRRTLRLDNLLAGKSRKEASRMFFETLVLKTRDFIHAEQEGPFGSISVKSRVKLTKAEF